MRNSILCVAFLAFVTGCTSSSNVGVTEFEAQLLDKRWELSSFQKTDGIEFDHTNTDNLFFSIEFDVDDDRSNGGAIRRSLNGGGCVQWVWGRVHTGRGCADLEGCNYINGSMYVGR